jgi:hypothetical protein
MEEKDIKRQIKKQLKIHHPDWRRLPKKEKKRVAKEVSESVIASYEGNHSSIPIEELIGLEDQGLEGVMSLEQMADFVTNFHQHKPCLDLGGLSKPKRWPEIISEELNFIDQLLDNEIINHLLANQSYSPQMRVFFPHHFLRAELIKALKYPEISYRKFCTREYMGQDRKENRRFMALPLNTKKMVDHTQLSQFRATLTFAQLTNLLVYVLYHGYQSGLLSDCKLHGVDSTEIANDNKMPLCSIKVKGKKIKIYHDIDCDSGSRRNKRDKSNYVVGYRMHTLTAINPATGHSYPLASLLAPANHHDSLFLKPLINLAQAMGIDMQLITADEAYHDKDGSIIEETGVNVIAPASTVPRLPDNVDPKTFEVYCDKYCDKAMARIGNTDSGVEYGCSADIGQCPYNEHCGQSRIVPFDRGHFQRMPVDSYYGEKALDIRKNIERPFNLIKKREGLENARVRSQVALVARVTFTTITTLMIEMAGTRKKPKKRDSEQLELLFDAA